MEDYLIRILAKEAGVRGLACLTTDLANEIAVRHDMQPTSTFVLGYGLTSAALLGALLKVQQRVALKYEGNGPARKMIVESDSYGRIRGYVAEPYLDLPLVDDRQDMTGAMGQVGLLTVVRDLRLKELAESVVPSYGDVTEDITRYLNQSDQTPSLVEIGGHLNDDGRFQVLGGLLIQSLPPYEDDLIQQLDHRIQELPPLQDMLRLGETPESILAQIFDDIPYETLEKRPLRFECSCSRARSEKALISLGRAELEQLIGSEEETVVDCHFCHEQYLFTREELEDLLVELDD